MPESTTWDDANERRFRALLDEADAKLHEWMTRRNVKEADLAMQRHYALAALEDGTALARARIAEWQQSHHADEIQEALEEAARRFTAAYDAAVKRYDLRPDD